MLTFEAKLAIIQTYPQLKRKDVSLGRINFHFEESAYDKKTVVYHLHPNGNGFVYAGQLQGYRADEKGFVNIRDYSGDDLRQLLDASIRSLSSNTESPFAKSSKCHHDQEETWIGPDQQSLLVKYEDEMWYIFTGPNLEDAFETYEEVEQYMQEEEFIRL